MRSRFKFSEEFGVYFITSTIVQFIPVFTSEKYFQIILDSFNFCRNEKDLKIHAYVIMDNHFHAVVSSKNLSNKIQSMKRHTAKEILNQLKKDNKDWLISLFQNYKKQYKKNSDHQIWQEGVHPQLIENINVLEQKVNYIHNNPVKRGLVRNPEDWVYSSATNFSGINSIFNVDEIDGF